MHLSEILLILVIALIVIKPEQLPGVAQKLGEALRIFRQTVTKIKNEIESTTRIPHD